jgi:hypothetical protein
MGGDIEQRLATAAGRLREYKIAVTRMTELRGRRRYIEAQIADLRAAHALEERDVERLERVSLASILATLRGARDDAMARERAEAEAAHYRVVEAQARRDALDREHTAVRVRLDALSSAPADYDAVLAEKERHLAESPDPRGRRLLTLAEERGRLTDEVRELTEAIDAAKTAQHAVAQLARTLRSASSWSTYDTFFGGGAISSAIKQSRLDDAAKEADYADHCLLLMRTELADVGGTPQTGWSIPIEGLTRFLDIWLDNPFTDFAVRERVRSATDRVESCARRVRNLIQDLWRRTDHAQQRLAAIDAERHQILDAPFGQ